MRQINRRSFIFGSVSALGLSSALNSLSACTTPNSGTTQALPRDVQLVQRFPQVLVPGEVRLPISLAGKSGMITTESDFVFPGSLVAKVVDLSIDKVIVENLNAELHGAEFAIPYYPFRLEISSAGNYLLIVEGGSEDGAAFSVLEREQVLVPLIGETLPAFDTPTFDDARSVEPICTRAPKPCPFHQMTLTMALQKKLPVAYLIGTPAHCSTGTCAPALEELMSTAESLGENVAFVHAEVYADEQATIVAPAVKAFEMTYEPALFITDQNGKIVDRLDAVFDKKEIIESLNQLKL